MVPLTPSAEMMARAIYEERMPDGTFDVVRLSILADALEEAGAGEEVVGHLREKDAVHVRGCWVVDLVLGKK